MSHSKKGEEKKTEKKKKRTTETAINRKTVAISTSPSSI